jgi:uncharacterized protein (DUF1810 family)
MAKAPLRSLQMGRRTLGAKMLPLRALSGSIFYRRFTQRIVREPIASEGATMSEKFDLQRFVAAQARNYADALAELRAGRKASHWMWYVFPQVAGLGSSAMAQAYAICSLAEARAYLADPVLGARLHECVAAVLAVQGRSAHEIFGSPDDLKLRSSLTLFAEAAPDEPLFREALARYFAGEPDPRTLERLWSGGGAE